MYESYVIAIMNG